MYHPDIDAWLQSRAEFKRLEELECKAADAWFETLSLEQRVVFTHLLTGACGEGINHVRQRFIREEVAAERKARGEED